MPVSGNHEKSALNWAALCLLSCSWVFIYEKAYQVSDTGIESSVMTKVKGYGYHNNRVMDVADYVFPQQVCNSDNPESTLTQKMTYDL